MARHPVMKMILHDSDSDDKLEMVTTCAIEMNKLNSEESSGVRRGSIQGHSVIFHNRVQGHERLYRDYFAEPPIYPLNLFRRRFRMNRTLFLRILFMVENYDPYFVPKKNAVGILGLSSLQKMTAAIRMLAYGVAADVVDDYVRIGERTTIESLKRFVSVVIARKALQGRAPPANFLVNENDYTMGYYLADGIYPKWATFVKIIPSPKGNKQIHFAKSQESARKDVERAFGVLQARFAIVRGPARLWKLEVLKDIMKACIILHNMIVEDERNANELDFTYDTMDESPTAVVIPERSSELLQFINTQHCIRDKEIHSKLQADLVKHQWNMHGNYYALLKQMLLQYLYHDYYYLNLFVY